jgi:hypothetical protein
MLRTSRAGVTSGPPYSDEKSEASRATGVRARLGDQRPAGYTLSARAGCARSCVCGTDRGCDQISCKSGPRGQTARRRRRRCCCCCCVTRRAFFGETAASVHPLPSTERERAGGEQLWLGVGVQGALARETETETERAGSVGLLTCWSQCRSLPCTQRAQRGSPRAIRK